MIPESEIKRAARQATIEFVVSKKITCDTSGQVLDARTTVVIEDADGRTLGAVRKDEWRRIREHFIRLYAERFPNEKTIRVLRMDSEEEVAVRA